MGFWKEITRPFKKVDEEIRRVGGQIGDVADKVYEEGRRIDKQVLDALGNIINPPTPGGDGGDAGPLPIPDPPIAYGMEGEGAYSSRRKSIKSGRGGTILAGPLSPGNVGKKILG